MKQEGSGFGVRGSGPESGFFRTPSGLVVLTILLGTLLRLVTSAAMGLGIDESYEVANARSFQLSFFDHAPVSFWMATVAMKVLGTDAALAVRLPFILLFAITTWLAYRLTERLFGARAGVWAAVLLNLTPLFSIVTGSWVLPDGPMTLAVLASACCLLPVLLPDGGRASPGVAWRAWLAGGFWIGAAMLSKYLAALYVLGLLVYIAGIPGCRRWLIHPAPYAGAVLSLVMFSPVLIWNAQHDWVSFAFQGSRAGGGGGLRPVQVLVMLGGQALYLLPWIWWPLLFEGLKAVRAGRAAPQTWLCACLGLVPVAVMTIIPLWGKQGLPHWTAVGYLFLFPLLGLAVASQINGPKGGLIRGWLKFSFVSFPLITAVLVSHAATGWGRALLPERIAREDPTMDMLSWRPVEALLAEHGLDARDRVVVATVRWIDGAKAGCALGARRPVTVFSQVPHNFPFLPDADALLGRDVVFVGRPDRLDGIETAFADSFDGFQHLGTVHLERMAGPEDEIEAVLALRMKRPYQWPYGMPRGWH